jgi:hypothetical protein
MKCKTIRDIAADVNCHPPYVSLNSLGRKVIKAGTIICKDEFPLADCVALIHNGLAVPDDDECHAACNRTAFQIAAAKAAMDKLLAGKSLSGLGEDEEDNEEDD